MLLHERPIHYVDHNYESRGVSLLHAKRYDFILRDGWGIECMYRVPIHQAHKYVFDLLSTQKRPM